MVQCSSNQSLVQLTGFLNTLFNNIIEYNFNVCCKQSEMIVGKMATLMWVLWIILRIVCEMIVIKMNAQKIGNARLMQVSMMRLL
jgi:hypothetical protein